MAKDGQKKTKGHSFGVRGSSGQHVRDYRYKIGQDIADALNPDKVPPKPSAVKIFTAEERAELMRKMKR